MFGLSKKSAFPKPPCGALTYCNWTFNRPDLHTLEHRIELLNNPGPTSNLYLQVYDANIDGCGQYFGVQTTGRVIFSRFGTVDKRDVRVGNAPGAHADFGTDEGPFITLRAEYGHLPLGAYKTLLVRGESERNGDWFDYYVQFPNGNEDHVGGIWFPRHHAHQPASFADGGGTWTEFWDNNNDFRLFPVPTWKLSVSLTANGHAPVAARTTYSAMPNSTVTVNEHGVMKATLGGATERLDAAGTVILTGTSG